MSGQRDHQGRHLRLVHSAPAEQPASAPPSDAPRRRPARTRSTRDEIPGVVRGRFSQEQQALLPGLERAPSEVARPRSARERIAWFGLWALLVCLLLLAPGVGALSQLLLERGRLEGVVQYSLQDLDEQRLPSLPQVLHRNLEAAGVELSIEDIWLELDRSGTAPVVRVMVEAPAERPLLPLDWRARREVVLDSVGDEMARQLSAEGWSVVEPSAP